MFRLKEKKIAFHALESSAGGVRAAALRQPVVRCKICSAETLPVLSLFARLQHGLFDGSEVTEFFHSLLVVCTEDTVLFMSVFVTIRCRNMLWGINGFLIRNVLLWN